MKPSIEMQMAGALNFAMNKISKAFDTPTSRWLANVKVPKPDGDTDFGPDICPIHNMPIGVNIGNDEFDCPGCMAEPDPLMSRNKKAE